MEDSETQGNAFPSQKNAHESAENAPKPWNPHCMHTRFSRIDRTKFKDRIEFLKECRRCGHHRVFVTKRDFNSSNVYVKSYWYDVPTRRSTVVDE
jgi:hypothetical protein